MKKLIKAIKTTLGGLDVNFVPFTAEVLGQDHVVLSCTSPQDWVMTTHDGEVLRCSNGEIDTQFENCANKFDYLIARINDAVNLSYLDHRDINRWIPKIFNNDVDTPYFNLITTLKIIKRFAKANASELDGFPYLFTINDDIKIGFYEEVGRPEVILVCMRIFGDKFWVSLEGEHYIHSCQEESLAVWCMRNTAMANEIISVLREQATELLEVPFHYEPPLSLMLLAELMDHTKYLATYGHLAGPKIDGGEQGVKLEVVDTEEFNKVLVLSIDDKRYRVSVDHSEVLEIPKDILPSDFLKLNMVLVTYLHNYFGNYDAEPEGRAYFTNLITDRLNILTEN